VSFEQAKYLKKLGHEITFITGTLSGCPDYEVIEGVQIRRVTAFHYLYKKFGIPYLIFSPALMNILSKEIQRADICLMHSFGFMSSFIAAHVCVVKKKPYILFQHNPFTKYENIFLNYLQTFNDYLTGIFIIKHANKVISISNFVRQYVDSLVKRDILVLYSGVDHEKFTPNSSKTKVKESINLPTDAFIVLTVRRLVYKNSVETIIDTASLYQKNTKILFVIVGDGPDYDLIVRKVKEKKLSNCKLTGSISSDLLPAYYQSADLFVLPSKVEGLGIVILEAMSSELPIIATDHGGQTELIKSLDNGILVKGTPTDFFKAINYFMNNPKQKMRIGKHNRKIVQSEFTWEKHIESLVGYLHDAARL
jgi:glycosyltransferase involved in cell wall biosynthesis